METKRSNYGFLKQCQRLWQQHVDGDDALKVAIEHITRNKENRAEWDKIKCHFEPDFSADVDERLRGE